MSKKSSQSEDPTNGMREFPRFDLADFSAVLKFGETLAQKKVLNISGGGIAFSDDEHRAIGVSFLFSVVFSSPSGTRYHFRVNSEVVRAFERDGLSFYAVRITSLLDVLSGVSFNGKNACVRFASFLKTML